MLPELEKRQVALVAISVDALDVSEKLAAAVGLTFPLASDPAHAVIDAFGVFDAENEVAWPAMYLVGRDRTIAWRFLGDTYKVRPSRDEILRAIDRP